MAIESILNEIDAEISRLTQIRDLLANTGTLAGKVAATKASKTAAKGKKRRMLSPDARKRIADAQRKRWAAQKAKTK
jgi:hypothetical protein